MAFFWASGVKSRGSGGAPPTHLILLRNQRPPVRSEHAHDAAGTPWPVRVVGGCLGTCGPVRGAVFLFCVELRSGWRKASEGRGYSGRSLRFSSGPV